MSVLHLSYSIKSVLHLRLLHQVCPSSAATQSSLSCICSYSMKSVLHLQLLHQVCPASAAPSSLSCIRNYSIRCVLYLIKFVMYLQLLYRAFTGRSANYYLVVENCFFRLSEEISAEKLWSTFDMKSLFLRHVELLTIEVLGIG